MAGDGIDGAHGLERQTARRLDDDLLAGLAGQLVVVLGLEAGEAAVVDAGEPDQLGGDGLHRIVAFLLDVVADARQAQCQRLGRQIGRGLPGHEGEPALLVAKLTVQGPPAELQRFGELPRRRARVVEHVRRGEDGAGLDTLGQRLAVALVDAAARGRDLHAAQLLLRRDPGEVALGGREGDRLAADGQEGDHERGLQQAHAPVAGGKAAAATVAAGGAPVAAAAPRLPVAAVCGHQRLAVVDPPLAGWAVTHCTLLGSTRW